MADTIEPRVAVLEQIARETSEILRELRIDVREMRARQDTDFRFMVSRQDRQFYWLVGIYLAGTAALLGVMAHGFKWL